MSCRVVSCHVMSRYDIMSCNVMLCLEKVVGIRVRGSVLFFSGNTSIMSLFHVLILKAGASEAGQP